MDPALQKSLALGVLPPALFTGIVLLLAWWWRRMPESAEARAALLPPSNTNTIGERLWLTPLVFAIAYLPVHHFLLGGFKPQPIAAADWMPHVAVLAGVLGALATIARMPIAVRWVWRALVCAAIAGAIASGKIRNGWPMSEAIPTLAAFVIHTLFAWWLFERVTDRTRGPGGPIILMIYAAGVSQVLVLAFYSLRLAQMPTAMAAVAGAAMVVALIRPRFTLAFGGVHVILLVSNAALLQGVLFPGDAILPRVLPWVLLASPLLAALADFIPLKGWKLVVVRSVLAVIPVAAAIGVAVSLRPADEY